MAKIRSPRPTLARPKIKRKATSPIDKRTPLNPLEAKWCALYEVWKEQQRTGKPNKYGEHAEGAARAQDKSPHKGLPGFVWDTEQGRKTGMPFYMRGFKELYAGGKRPHPKVQAIIDEIRALHGKPPYETAQAMKTKYERKSQYPNIKRNQKVVSKPVKLNFNGLARQLQAEGLI